MGFNSGFKGLNITGICRLRKSVTNCDRWPTQKGGQLHRFYCVQTSVINRLTQHLIQKIKQQTLESQITTKLYIYIYIYIQQTMVTNNYMFRPLTGHFHWMYNLMMTCQRPKHVVCQTSYIVYCTALNPFHWMYNLMMTCQRPKHVVVSCYHRLLYISFRLIYKLSIRCY